MTALAALLALPVTAIVVVILLRSSRAVAAFGADLARIAGTRPPPRRSVGVAIFAGFTVAVLAGLAIGGIGSTRRDRRRSRRRRDRVRRSGSSTTCGTCHRSRSSSHRSVAAVVVLSSGISVEIVDNADAAVGPRDPLDRRDEQRLQPARQHGRARREPRSRRRWLFRDRRGARQPQPRDRIARGRRSRSRVSGSCRGTSDPVAAPRCSWATRGARCSVSCSRPAV